MGYNLEDYKNESFGLLENGEYEAFIEQIEIRKAQSSGNEYISLQIRIRDDVDQSFGNRVLFDNVFKEKDSAGNQTEYFNRSKLTRILKATIPADTPLEFESVEDILETVAGQKVIAVVKTRKDDYRGEDVNYISYYKQTNVPDKVLEVSTKNNADESLEKMSGKPNVINEEDLPF